MDLTSVSFLDRLKVATPDDPEWRRLDAIYLPLIRACLARVPGLGDETSDLAQEVFIVVIRELPKFERQRAGSFRAWLRQITVNRIRAYCRDRQRRPATGWPDEGTHAFLGELEDSASVLAKEWDRQHDQHVFQQLLAVLQPEFTSSTWEAFRRFGLSGQSAAVVASQLGLSENAVILSKSRILKRLREEAAGLID